MKCSPSGFPVLHCLLEFAQTHPLSQWCHLTISSSAAPFSFCEMASEDRKKEKVPGVGNGRSKAGSMIELTYLGSEPSGILWTVRTVVDSQGMTRSGPCAACPEEWHFFWHVLWALGFPGGSYVKESACNAGDPGLIPEWGRSPGEGHGHPLQYSYWRIPWTEEADGLQSLGSQRVRYDWMTNTFTLWFAREHSWKEMNKQENIRSSRLSPSLHTVPPKRFYPRPSARTPASSRQQEEQHARILWQQWQVKGCSRSASNPVPPVCTFAGSQVWPPWLRPWVYRLVLRRREPTFPLSTQMHVHICTQI